MQGDIIHKHAPTQTPTRMHTHRKFTQAHTKLGECYSTPVQRREGQLVCRISAIFYPVMRVRVFEPSFPPYNVVADADKKHTIISLFMQLVSPCMADAAAAFRASQ